MSMSLFYGMILGKGGGTNMDAWDIEKSGNVLRELVEIAEMLKNKELKFETCEKMINYPETAEERFKGCLQVALHDQLKIYSSFLGENWDPEYVFWIIEEGYEGYERVLVEMNQLKETKKDKQRRILREMIDSLKIYVDNKNFNRTLIHETLRQYRNNAVDVSEDIQKIENNIEKVTMGEMKVEEFINIANPIIEKLENQLNN